MVEDSIFEDEAIVNDKPIVVRLCDMCQKEPFKYKCPRCSLRTCSLPCLKLHKEQLKCNGQRDPGTFGAIKRLADFTAPIAVNDRKFLDTLKDGAVDVVNAALACDTPTLTLPSKQIETNSQEVISDKKPPLHHIIDENSSVNFHNEDPQPKNSEDVLSNGLEPETSCITNPECNDRNGIEEMKNENCNSGKKIFENRSNEGFLTSKQRYLCINAHRRRIWLEVSKDKEEGTSRHEQFSDTIFWTIALIFRREEGEGEGKRIIDYTFTANNIPESIAVATLLRQFLKPKKIGPVVNRDELDAAKMAPFQEAGIEHVLVYMPVPMEDKRRFYVVDSTKKILDNLRNRFILDHPTFIVTLDNQCNDYVALSEQEAQELREAQRQRKREADQARGDFRNGFGNHRGGGFNRGGYHSRGGLNGEGFDRSGFGGYSRGRGAGRGGWKRSFDGGDGYNGGRGNRWQRGGSSSKRGWGGRRGHDDWESRNMDPIEMPPDALTNADASHFRSRAPPRGDPVMNAWCEAIGMSPEKKSKLDSANLVKGKVNNQEESQATCADKE
uniref:Box C/D snoRNA protein 1 n=1 Tax=Ascaris lumbricoides TaxID=6252 RepID=A0A0M3I5K3_ASCLU